MQITQSAFPASGPFVLVAESFSTPLAIQLAATNPPNLKGIVLCAGFITSPVRGRLRRVGLFFSPVLFSAGLPESAARYWLTGSSASPALLASVRAAISSVRPAVLSARLRAVLTCDASVELEKIAVPILYLQAKKDRLVKESSLNEIRRIKTENSRCGYPRAASALPARTATCRRSCGRIRSAVTVIATTAYNNFPSDRSRISPRSAARKSYPGSSASGAHRMSLNIRFSSVPSNSLTAKN
jgi:serine aminopeptidase S33 family